MSEVSYHFNSYFYSNWNNPSYLIDNILTNFGYHSVDGASTRFDGNTCLGTDLGTITKVEIRAYGYGDVNDRIDIQPRFGGSSPGDVHETTPGTTAAWGAYQDITNDTNHPSPWAWSDVQALDCDITKENVSKGNQMNCAKVEIRVTYTPTAEGVTRSYGYVFG